MTSAEELKLLTQFNDLVLDNYKKHGLECLRGIEKPYEFEGKPLLTLYHDTIRRGALKYSGVFDFHKNIDDLLFCSDEVIYYLSQMYLYRDHINNPLKDAFNHAGTILYPNYQNMPAKRYSMCANIVSEKLYNYWDRIGDLIATYFPQAIKPERAFFPTALDAVDSKFHASTNYLWLLTFKVGKYKELNDLRKEVVHYHTEDTNFKHEHIHGATDKAKVEKLYNDRLALADKFNHQLTLSLQGFSKTMALVTEISVDLPDIPTP